jgi:hypothetical protein
VQNLHLFPFCMVDSRTYIPTLRNIQLKKAFHVNLNVILLVD